MNTLPIDTLVNKENLISPIDYKPLDLVTMDDNKDNFHNYIDPNLKPQISNTILKPFRQLEKSFNEFFKEADIKLVVDSGYRSYEYQKRVYKNKIQELGKSGSKLVARPGSSEHQTGLAIDVAFIKNGIFYDQSSDSDPNILWLVENSWKYGFILRYPKGKEHITGYNYERWHYRFVGIEVAKIIHDNDITLEEYHQIYKNK